MKKLLRIVVVLFYRILDTEIDLFEIKQSFSCYERGKPA